MLDHIFEAYDAVLVLDTETTGISCRKDEIIELAVLKAGQADGALCELETMDEFIRLSEGRRLPDKIVELTGITEQMLLDDAAGRIDRMVAIATPFNGSHLAHLVPTPAIWPLRPSDPTIQALAARTDVNERIVSIYAAFDPHIPGGSELPGAVNVPIDAMGHFRVMGHRDTLAAVEAAVSAEG